MTSCSASPTETVAPNGDNADIYYGGIHEVQSSLEGYYNYLETYQKQIPEAFVHLENLPELGTFNGFVPTLDFPNRYQYSFADKGGKSLYVVITHLSSSNDGSLSTSEHNIATVSKDMTSMRKKPSSETKSVIVHNGVEYYYNARGKLGWIIWNDGEIQYKVSGQVSTYSNPIYLNLISLGKTEASAALAEFKQALNSK